VLGPTGNRSDRYAPHGAYRCADEDGHERWIAIAVADESEWQSLTAKLGIAAEDARFATMIGRLRNREALDQYVGALVRERNADELTVALQAVGVSAYPVQSCMDIHRDENLEAFGFWQWLDHKTMGPSPYEGFEHRMSRTPGSLRAAPALGQHSDEVLSEILGMTAAEIEELKREKVIY
jgi:benzylsuccinate CoA-transferase BbsF subunit